MVIRSLALVDIESDLFPHVGLESTMLRTALLVAFLVLLSACSSAKPSFRVAQMCLTNEQDVLRFVQEMKDIANEEQMEFVDASADTARGLDTIGYEDRGRASGSPTIHLAIQRTDGMGVTAGNMGLPGYQLALGFSEGSDRSGAVRFADKVINRLGRYWRVEVLPAGSGVMPDPTCS